MSKLLQLPAIISKITSMRNRSLRCQVDTNEDLSDEQMQKVMSNIEKYGHFCFLIDSTIKEEDIVKLPPLPARDKNEKSPSQTMRNIIYRIWENNTNKKQPFPDYYNSYMFKLNEKLKEKI